MAEKMEFCYHCMTPIEDEKLYKCPNCGKELSVSRGSTKFLRAGTVLRGKYIIGYPLGAGGFGNTYIGYDMVLKRKLAIKEFYPEQYSSRSEDGITVSVTDDDMKTRFHIGIQQFLEEARSIAALKDIKGVVEIYDFFEQNGTGYIVMEYLEGTDVKSLLKKMGGKSDHEWAIKVILTILYYLKDVHKRGMLHRDIAPDNVFVTKEGIIKLIDFGAAKHAMAEANMRQEIVLKVGYAPIEQYSRKTVQGPYTDIYEVAALFYRMLSGKKPVPANERIGDKDPLKSLSDIGISVPKETELAIMVCLNVQPRYRLQSAEEFMEALGGENFIPAYDDIIPKEFYEETGLRYRLGRMPIAGKVAACALLICMVGGIMAGVSSMKKGDESLAMSGSENVLWEGYSDINNPKTLEIVDKYLKKEIGGKVRSEDYYNVRYKYILDENIADNTIIEQSLNPGQPVSKTEKNVFCVASRSMFTMENYVGKKISDVKQQFKEWNFDVAIYSDPEDKDFVKKEKGINTKGLTNKPEQCSIIYKFSEAGSKNKKNIIMDQIPKEGTIIHDNVPEDKIQFIVTIGEKKEYLTPMPSLLGSSFGDAEKKLKEKGLDKIINLKKSKDREYSDTVPEGGIISQDIKEGKDIYTLRDDKKQDCKVIISKGSKPVVTPKPEKKETVTRTHDGSTLRGSSSKKNKNEKSKLSAGSKKKKKNKSGFSGLHYR